MTSFLNYMQHDFVMHDEPIDRLRTRWEGGLFAILRTLLIKSIQSGSEIPEDIATHVPTITYAFCEKTTALLDFRGIDLSACTRIGKIDLSYCCFDGAILSNVLFEATAFQFSSFRQANFVGSRWVGVQATPIYAPEADFTGATVEDSFLLHSNLRSANLQSAHFIKSALDGSNLEGVRLDAYTAFRDSDIINTSFTDSVSVRSWLGQQLHLHGTPRWMMQGAQIEPSEPVYLNARMDHSGATTKDIEESSNQDCWKLWNWDKPFFGELTLYPERADLFIGRDELLSRAALQIQKQISMSDSSITLVCGSPGVGKSTFVDHLLRSHFSETGKRISLIGYTDNPFTGNSQLGVDQLLTLFSQVESFLNAILADKDDGHHSEANIIDDRHVTIAKLEPIDAIELACSTIKETLAKKCARIHELRGRVRQHYLAIDDVDYLSPRDQARVLSILCSMATVSTNPAIMYSARPAAAGIAKHSVTSLMNHAVTEPIKIPALDPNQVIDVRIKHQNRNAINPFAEEATSQFISKLTNGNLRIALDYAKKAAQEGHDYVDKRSKVFSKKQFLHLLFGDAVTNKADLLLTANAEKTRDIVNLFLKIHDDDEVPLIYVTLLTVGRSPTKKVDRDFYLLFNRICGQLNPKGIGQKVFAERQILDYLTFCHRAHLIRRIDFVYISEYIALDHNTDPTFLLKNTLISITPRGEELLQLTKEADYQNICGLRFWRKDIQDKIQSWRFGFSPKFDGEFIMTGDLSHRVDDLLHLARGDLRRQPNP